MSLLNCLGVDVKCVTKTCKMVGKPLRSFLNNVNTHLRSLTVLEQDVNQSIFIPMITSKLPREVVVQLEIQKKKEEMWTISLLLERLDNLITARESVERVFNSPTHSPYIPRDTPTREMIN